MFKKLSKIAAVNDYERSECNFYLETRKMTQEQMVEIMCVREIIELKNACKSHELFCEMTYLRGENEPHNNKKSRPK